jgi:peptidoglycan-N-acetylglucosamine deacetylase
VLAAVLLLHHGSVAAVAGGSSVAVPAASAVVAARPVATGAKKCIALTFDDFPFPDATPKLLEVLAAQDVHVTFFAIGHKLKDHPEFAAQALYQGHSLENHTFDHPRLTTCTPDQIRRELTLCNQVIRDLTGSAPRYLRSPGGRSTPTIRREAATCGLECVDTMVTNIGDMAHTTAEIVKRCSEGAHPGAIFSLHDGVPETIEALPIVITKLRHQGYQFVTVQQLLRGNESG